MDDDELLRALTRIAQQDRGSDPRTRKLVEETDPEGEQGAAARPGEGRDERGVRTPLDDETRARLADELIAQLREPRGDAPAPLSRPIVDRKSGIRFRGPHEWDCEADEPDEAVAAPQFGADADSLSGTSSPLKGAPLNTDAPVCRAIGGSEAPPGASVPPGASAPPTAASMPPRDVVCESAATWSAAGCTPYGANAGVLAPRARPACPELLVERRTSRQARARAIAGMAGWAAAAALVSLLALRPAPFAPGAAPLPDYTVATTLGDGPPLGDGLLPQDHGLPLRNGLPQDHGLPLRNGLPQDHGLPLGNGLPLGEPGAPRRVGRGARLTITLAPGGRVHAPVDVKAFLVQGGRARPWPVAIHLDERGGARISGTREELFKDVAAGAWEAVFVIGHPGSLPDVAEALSDGPDVHLAGGRIVRERLFLD
ncbi:hypothetical protein [Sorangium sp. So ce1024]|uniref:hypothetical protein n=1 Tax=Sorangium sp. So ce1024 TaxID=3133327 RepID=UPI003F030170